MENLTQLKELADNIRANALTMAYCAGSSAAHLGGGLSHIDILAVLYGKIMKHDALNPYMENRDRFILSKGHGVLGYYGALCEMGYIKKEELYSFEKNGSSLLGHPVQNIEKGIELTTGSLGQGLSNGIGIALGLKEKNIASKVYVLMGDGECNEGSVWEAFMSASQFKLNNIVAIIDRNRLQLGGYTNEVMDVGDIACKIRAFGWEVREIDGHNIDDIYEAFITPTNEDRPLAIVANTVKGHGFSFSEDNNAYHHAVVTKDLFLKGMSELGKDVDAEEVRQKVEDWNSTHKVSIKKKDVLDEYKEVIDSKIIITKQLARRWSMVGQRAAFGLATVELAKDNPNMKVITADVSTSAGLERLKNNYPENFVDVGIAEQNMMGIASGYSQLGYDVITTTFAPFQTMRCLEQIRVNMGYMGSKVIMVGLASGLVLGTLGNTHCCFEDMGVLKSIPNIAIVSPADCCEVGKALEDAIRYDKSVYIRLMNGAGCPVVYNEDYNFEIGKSITLKGDLENKVDVTIFACGTMVNESLKAADILQQKGINVNVVNMHTIKPIDVEAIEKAVNNSKIVVTVEEHNKYGGLGTAIAEELVKYDNSPRQLMIALPDMYGNGGNYSDLLELYGLKDINISEKIEKVLGI